MDVQALLAVNGLPASPLAFAALAGLAVLFAWQAFRPAQPARQVRSRLDDYVEQGDTIEDADMDKPFMARAVMPLVYRLLRTVGRLAPTKSLESTRKLLLQAGQPGGLMVLDFYGLRLLAMVLVAGATMWITSKQMPFSKALLYTAIGGGIGFFLPLLWVRNTVSGRKREIMRSLPNALDMLTIGVEAGLAFESALLRVVERWDNALSQEFRRAIVEMRVGTPREEALERLAERADVPDLCTFVAVLVQSTQLGVSIADVLHIQAAQIREKRRLRAEELARQAGIKIMFPLVFFIFPSMFVVLLGPALPTMMETFANLGAR